MSKKNELAVFQSSIAIPGVKFTRTSVEFDRVDAETLVRVGAFLQAVDACSAWWWGDYLVAHCGYELKSEEKENGVLDEITRVNREKQYSARYAVMCDKEPKTLWHWKAVASFFNSSRRREELSQKHHVEAMNGSEGDKAIADNWLDIAVDKNWSCSELRAAIRKSKRLENEPDEPLPQMVLPLQVVECGRWANIAKKRVDTMDIKEAAAIYAEMQPILAYANLLAARLLAADGVGGAKESILQSAPQR